MPLIRFDDILGEQLEDPETARLYERECRASMPRLPFPVRGSRPTSRRASLQSIAV